MDALSIEGKNFVKASRVARDYGYTSDYVGQLCRSKKVEAKLVGRSWYVNISSLEEHLNHRYKKIDVKEREPKQGYDVLINSNQGIEDEEQRQVDVESHLADDSKVSTLIKSSFVPKQELSFVEKRFYARVPRYIKSNEYNSDDTGLIPAVKKSTNQGAKVLPINLADAASISITSERDSYTFETPALPDVHFSGEIKVSDLPQDEILELPKEVPKTEASELLKARKNLLLKKQLPVASAQRGNSDQKNKAKSVHLPVHLRNLGNTAIQDVAIRSLNQNEVNLGRKVALTGTVLTSVLIAALIYSAESHVTSTAKLSVETITVSVNNLRASLYDSIKGFLE